MGDRVELNISISKSIDRRINSLPIGDRIEFNVPSEGLKVSTGFAWSRYQIFCIREDLAHTDIIIRQN